MADDSDDFDVPADVAARLVRALDRLPGSIACLIEPDLSIGWLSHSARWVTGSDPDQRGGDDSFARIHPEDAGKLLHGLAQMRSLTKAQGTDMPLTGPLRYRFQRVDNDEWMVMEAHVHALEADPEVNGLLVIARPVDGHLDGVGHIIDLLVMDAPLPHVLAACAQLVPATAASAAVVGMVGGETVTGADPVGPASELVKDDRWWRETLQHGTTRVEADFGGFPDELAQEARTQGFRNVWVWPLRDHSSDEVLGALVVWVRFSGEYNITADEMMRQVERVAGMVLSEQRRTHALRQEVLTDSLTGVGNRSALRNRLDSASGALTVAVVDLDDFKPVNDQHGHAVGDEVLGVVARRLVAAVRDDDLVIRLGGDEFVIVFADGTPPEACVSVVSRLTETISQPIRVAGGLTLSVTASAGLATGSPSQAIRAADARLFEAKKAKPSVHVSR